MAKTFEYSMKIPFDMSDVNGFIKIPQLILLSLQVSGMQSIELGMSDMYILENYNLVWIITCYNMKIDRLPVFDEKSLSKPMPRVTIDFSATGPLISRMKQAILSLRWSRPLS